MRFQFVANHQDEFCVHRMCQVLGISTSGYYAWRKRQPNARKMANEILLSQIQQIHQECRGTYGSPRIHATLVRKGIVCGLHRVARLMQQSGICAKGKRRYKQTTQSRPAYSVSPNVLNRMFTANAPNQKWLGDITYLPTGEGWLFLAVVMDLYSRRIVGWAMAEHMQQELTLKALHMARKQRKPQPDLLHYTDRGSQYAAYRYQEILRHHQFQVSMSRFGNCYDNAPMESFFATLKAELANYGRYRTRQQARAEIFEYIEVFYNRQRRHSSLDYLSPLQFEQKTITSFPSVH